MFLAQFESSNFLFEAAGNTEQQARVLLNKLIRLHCHSTNAHIEDFFEPEEVQVRELRPGCAWVDGQKRFQDKVK